MMNILFPVLRNAQIFLSLLRRSKNTLYLFCQYNNCYPQTFAFYSMVILINLSITFSDCFIYLLLSVSGNRIESIFIFASFIVIHGRGHIDISFFHVIEFALRVILIYTTPEYRAEYWQRFALTPHIPVAASSFQAFRLR